MCVGDTNGKAKCMRLQLGIKTTGLQTNSSRAECKHVLYAKLLSVCVSHWMEMSRTVALPCMNKQKHCPRLTPLATSSTLCHSFC